MLVLSVSVRRILAVGILTVEAQRRFHRPYTSSALAEKALRKWWRARTSVTDLAWEF